MNVLPPTTHLEYGTFRAVLCLALAQIGAHHAPVLRDSCESADSIFNQNSRFSSRDASTSYGSIDAPQACADKLDQEITQYGNPPEFPPEEPDASDILKVPST